VINKDCEASLCIPHIRAWWDQVTVTPDLKRIKVLRSGTSNALKVKIDTGGQTFPISGVGLNLLWKKAQKNLRKKKISDTINKAIPQRKPSSTIEEWSPCKEASDEISLHQEKEIKIRVKSLIHVGIILDSWNHWAKANVRFKDAAADKIGQGDSSTKWYGWRIRLDIVLYYPLQLQRNILLN